VPLKRAHRDVPSTGPVATSAGSPSSSPAPHTTDGNTPEPGATGSTEPLPEKKPHASRQAPGTAVIDVVIGLDRDADGVLSSCELEAGKSSLQALACDGRGNDAAEARLVKALQDAAAAGAQAVASFSVCDGKLELAISKAGHSRFRGTYAHNREPNAAGLDRAATSVDGIEVGQGRDPGNYYCEHMFYSAQLAASDPGSSVALNSAGEPLVGFLHVPSDVWQAGERGIGYALKARHDKTCKVIAAAIRGYYDTAASQVREGPICILLTGYGSFMSITNNPTGEFVSNRANIDAAMQQAFGTGVVRPAKEGKGGRFGAATAYRYHVRTLKTGVDRDVVIAGAEFPVADSTVDPNNAGSVQAVMRAFSPQAVISMGVAGDGPYLAEHHADSGGLNRAGSSPVHDDAVGEGVALRDNYSLTRAIQRGAPLLMPSRTHRG
jgi:hypothetical protein